VVSDCIPQWGWGTQPDEICATTVAEWQNNRDILTQHICVIRGVHWSGKVEHTRCISHCGNWVDSRWFFPSHTLADWAQAWLDTQAGHVHHVGLPHTFFVCLWVHTHLVSLGALDVAVQELPLLRYSNRTGLSSHSNHGITRILWVHVQLEGRPQLSNLPISLEVQRA
jgi:hypothetical protein